MSSGYDCSDLQTKTEDRCRDPMLVNAGIDDEHEFWVSEAGYHNQELSRIAVSAEAMASLALVISSGVD